MKKVSSIVILSAMILCLGSCINKPSKQYQAMEKEVSSIETVIGETTNCDDLQMLNFGILGLRSDLDNLKQTVEVTESEIRQLEEMLNRLDATWEGKWSSLGCNQVNYSDDELDTSGENDAI